MRLNQVRDQVRNVLYQVNTSVLGRTSRSQIWDNVPKDENQRSLIDQVWNQVECRWALTSSFQPYWVVNEDLREDVKVAETIDEKKKRIKKIEAEEAKKPYDGLSNSERYCHLPIDQR